MIHTNDLRWQLLPATRFDEIAADWDRLASHSATAVFLDTRFMRPLIETFGTGAERIAVGTHQGAVVALAVLQPQATGRWQLFQPSQLPTGPLVLAPDLGLQVAAAGLVRALPFGTLIVGLTQLDSLAHPPPRAAPDAEQSPYIETAWVDVEGSFEAYWEGRGKNLRQNMRKQRRKLEEESIEARLETLTAAHDVAQAIADYGTLESAGWKADSGTAVHPDNPQGRFYRSMLEAFCAAGRGRIYRYRFNDCVVAIDLCIENEHAIVVLKTTYDESQQKTYSPALLMREDAFAQLWREGRLRRIEFYGKVMDWHRRWTDQSRPLYHYTQFRWPWLRVLRDALRRRPAGPPDQPPALALAPQSTASPAAQAQEARPS
jgi:CelD/BcsL family acetyltransferase involved in cellulose biosynthesis